MATAALPHRVRQITPYIYSPHTYNTITSSVTPTVHVYEKFQYWTYRIREKRLLGHVVSQQPFLNKPLTASTSLNNLEETNSGYIYS